MRPCDRLSVNSRLHATCIGMSSASPFSRGGLGLRSAVLTANARVLGQLGGQSPHDPKETSSGGGSDFARVVSATCCWIPHCCCSSGTGRVGSHWIRCTFLDMGWRSASCGFRFGGPADWHARPWVAAGSNRSRALTPRGEPGPTTFERDGAGTVAFSRRPNVGCPFFLFSYQRVGTVRLCTVWVFLLRRLWLPLPPSSRNCRCGRLLDVFGHHRAACAEDGRRSFALDLAAARVCREAQISWFVTWIWCLRVVRTVADSRWLLTDFRCFTEHNWPLTPH